MKPILSIILKVFFLLLFIACGKVFEPTNDYDPPQNPVVITYDKVKEEITQTKWYDFLTKYSATPDTHRTHFMKPTSVIMQAYFEGSLPKILSISLSDSNDSNIASELLDFYSEWEDLFGCKVNNMKLKDSYFYDFNENVTCIFRFQQIKIGNTSCKFVYQPFIEFTLTENMELKNIISTLIPDVEIEIPSRSNWVTISKLVKNTMGYEHEFFPDASSIYFPPKHVFSLKDKYSVKNGFEIYPNYSEDTLSIYYLKGIEYFWNGNNTEYKCTVYYHPSTNEIIHVKKW